MGDVCMEDGGTSAKIVADSISDLTGDRVTSFEVRLHRFALAELNTHAVFARNSASSRAIPVAKQLGRFVTDPAWPVAWPAEQKGMSGGAELEGDDWDDARMLFSDVKAFVGRAVAQYVAEHPEPQHRLHKSLLNRLLEPMQWHTALITAATFENFFDQRCSTTAQPELRKVAEMMQELYRAHEPDVLGLGKWHLPYLPAEEAKSLWPVGDDRIGLDARAISSARCARLSYMTQAGVRDREEDASLYNRLVLSGHWSPLEHVATPWSANVHDVPIIDPDTRKRLGVRRLPRLGKFPGWTQWRHVEEGRRGVNTYR